MALAEKEEPVSTVRRRRRKKKTISLKKIQLASHWGEYMNSTSARTRKVTVVFIHAICLLSDWNLFLLAQPGQWFENHQKHTVHLTLLSLATATTKRWRVLQEMSFLLLTLADAWPHLNILWCLVEGVKLHSRNWLDDISTCFSHLKGFTDWEF